MTNGFENLLLFAAALDADKTAKREKWCYFRSQL